MDVLGAGELGEIRTSDHALRAIMLIIMIARKCTVSEATVVMMTAIMTARTVTAPVVTMTATATATTVTATSAF